MNSHADRPPAKIVTPIRQLMKVIEVAEVCGVSEKTVRRWIAAGDLEAVRLGRQLRVTPDAVELLLAANKTGTSSI